MGFVSPILDIHSLPNPGDMPGFALKLILTKRAACVEQQRYAKYTATGVSPPAPFDPYHLRQNGLLAGYSGVGQMARQAVLREGIALPTVCNLWLDRSLGTPLGPARGLVSPDRGDSRGLLWVCRNLSGKTRPAVLAAYLPILPAERGQTTSTKVLEIAMSFSSPFSPLDRRSEQETGGKDKVWSLMPHPLVAPGPERAARNG